MPDTRQGGQGPTEQGDPRKQDEGARRQTEQGQSNPKPNKQGDTGSGTGRENPRQV